MYKITDQACTASVRYSSTFYIPLKIDTAVTSSVVIKGAARIAFRNAREENAIVTTYFLAIKSNSSAISADATRRGGQYQDVMML